MKRENINVLLADDDEEDRNFFEEALNKLNKQLSLDTVYDGLSLMNSLKNNDHHKPDVIFLDLNMPFKNGHECLKEIKSDPKLKNIPVVIYSTSAGKDQIESTYKEGANLYITKPDSITKLEEIVDGVFSLKCAEYKPQPKKEKFVFK
jgi:CheY-like chemotaxis protein